MTNTYNIFQNQLDKETRDELNRIGWDEAAEKFSKVRTHLETSFKGSKGFLPTMSGDYDLVAQIQAESLEDVFQISNLQNEESLVTRFAPMHSLSVGDVVQRVDDPSYPVGGTFYMVDNVGFTKIEFRVCYMRFRQPEGLRQVLVFKNYGRPADRSDLVNLPGSQRDAKTFLDELIASEGVIASVMVEDAGELLGRDMVTANIRPFGLVEIRVERQLDRDDRFQIWRKPFGQRPALYRDVWAGSVQERVASFCKAARDQGFRAFVNDHSGIDWTVEPF